ncbi:MAG: hypothetical protein JNL11_03135 [Bdellovibrionaceae bacterium]|nr:hypothetical protein [Pseudobdellovibrionaceae bacterium]
MDFNSTLKIALTTGLSALFIGCYPGPNTLAPDTKAENLIGIPLAKNSKLQSANDEDSPKIVVFDKTIRRVHHFDLETTEHLGLFEVERSDEDHFLVYGSEKNYFIDMTKKHVSIQNLNNRKQAPTVAFVGTPLSASYDSKQGYLVVYDSYQSVLILKIDDNGKIVRQFISGPVVDSDGTIQAGDISGNGKLVLSIRGTPAASTGAVLDSIFLVDIEQTLAESNTDNKLIGEKIPTNLTEMSWVAPVPGSPNLVMIRSTGQISLMDLVSKSVISMPTDTWVVEKYSKIKDPHIVMRKNYDFYENINGNVERRLYYTENGVLKTKTQTKNFNFILNSHLDVKKGHWNVTKVNTVREYDLYNSYNSYFEGRSFTRIRLSDLLTVIDTKIADKATVEMSGNYLFTLFSNPMGSATKTNIETNESTTLHNFNVKYLK